jgi:hypothetical protein
MVAQTQLNSETIRYEAYSLLIRAASLAQQQMPETKLLRTLVNQLVVYIQSHELDQQAYLELTIKELGPQLTRHFMLLRQMLDELMLAHLALGNQARVRAGINIARLVLDFIEYLPEQCKSDPALYVDCFLLWNKRWWEE